MATEDVTTGKVETPKDFGPGDAGVVKRWLSAIKVAAKEQDKWEQRADLVVARYRDERDELTGPKMKRFNILWSNTETLKPAVYSKPPKPQVTRRFKDDKPVEKEAAEILERALAFSVEEGHLDPAMRNVRDDYLLPGRGTARVRYIPTFGQPEEIKVGLNQGEGGDFTDETGEQFEFEEGEAPQFDPNTGQPFALRTQQNVVFEEVVVDYVFWKDFLHGPGRDWVDVPWVAFRSLMTRNALVERFGAELGNKVKLDQFNKALRVNKQDPPEQFKRGVVWEIWDKIGNETLWIAPTIKERPLDSGDPPLTLQGFFPCPKPLYAVETTDTLQPIPEFAQYQDQAQEIDMLTNRIHRLIMALKVTGLYDAAKEEIGRMLNEGFENELIPVDDWSSFAQTGGVAGNVAFMPIEEIAKVVISLYQARDKSKQEMFEITGIADLIRGANETNVTATAERIKGQFATMRLSDKQRTVANFSRDLIRLQAEVIAEEFEPQTISLMTGRDVTPQIMEIFRADPLRTFKLDIETDSTIQPDEQADKEARVEFLSGVSTFMQTFAPMVQQGQVPLDMAKELLLFGVRGFKIARDLENVLEQLGADQQLPQLQAQVKQLTDQLQQTTQQLQIAQQVIEGDQVEEAAKTEREQIKQQAENERAAANLAMDQQASRREVIFRQQIATMQEESKRMITLAQEETKRLIAGIAKRPQLSSAELEGIAVVIANRLNGGTGGP